MIVNMPIICWWCHQAIENGQLHEECEENARREMQEDVQRDQERKERN